MHKVIKDYTRLTNFILYTHSFILYKRILYTRLSKDYLDDDHVVEINVDFEVNDVVLYVIQRVQHFQVDKALSPEAAH